MKTKMNVANLKKMAVTACSALILSTGSFTQPMTNQDEEMNSMARLEAFMSVAEHSMKYVAPVFDETDEILPVMERLDLLAGNTEASLQYTAPAAGENEEVNSALENLEMMLRDIEASARYSAPANEENSRM